MFKFVRNLSLNGKDTLHDVAESCDKIIWLSAYFTLQSTLHYEDVEGLLKAAVYIEECIDMFGELQIMQILMEEYPQFNEFYNAQADFLKKDVFISHTIKQILATRDGVQHLPIIEEILRNFYDNEQIENLIELKDADQQDLSENLTTQAQIHRSRMLLCLQKLFQLPEDQFQLCLDRTISQLHFQVLGHILLERTESVYFPSCSILVHHVCQSLSGGYVSAHLIDSLKLTVAFNSEGRFYYWKLLRNKLFAYHLRNFFIMYFESLVDENEVPERLQHYNFENIAYLLSIALCEQSPCRLAYQRAINKAKILPFYVNFIQRCIVIYH